MAALKKRKKSQKEAIRNQKEERRIFSIIAVSTLALLAILFFAFQNS